MCSLLYVDQAKIVDLQAKLADTADVSARQALVDKIEGYHGMRGCFARVRCALECVLMPRCQIPHSSLSVRSRAWCLHSYRSQHFRHSRLWVTQSVTRPSDPAIQQGRHNGTCRGCVHQPHRHPRVHPGFGPLSHATNDVDCAAEPSVWIVSQSWLRRIY
jgi:hypothetical protein